MKSFIAKVAATAACAFIVSTAGAQSAGVTSLPTLALPSQAFASRMEMSHATLPGFALASSTSHETWHTVLLVSAVLLFVGLVDDNSGLVILGGAGVLVSLSETNGNAYRMRAGGGFEMLKMGHMSLGLNPFGQMGWSGGNMAPRPNIVLQAKFKF